MDGLMKCFKFLMAFKMLNVIHIICKERLNDLFILTNDTNLKTTNVKYSKNISRRKSAGCHKYLNVVIKNCNRFISTMDKLRILPFSGF